MLNLNEIMRVLDIDYIAEILEEKHREEMLFQTIDACHTAIENRRITKKVKEDSQLIKGDIEKVNMGIMEKLNNDIKIFTEEIERFNKKKNDAQ